MEVCDGELGRQKKQRSIKIKESSNLTQKEKWLGTLVFYVR